MILLNQTKNSPVLSQLSEAKSFWPRLKGLLGHADLNDQEGLWIHQCNSIHTFGMRFTIDCIFLNSDLKVKKIVENVKPNRMVLPIWGAVSVVELAAGQARKQNVEKGDQLHVGT